MLSALLLPRNSSKTHSDTDEKYVEAKLPYHRMTATGKFGKGKDAEYYFIIHRMSNCLLRAESYAGSSRSFTQNIYR
ncbi:hypothetical protein GYMLUDRAFT_941035 [Collybiopsis luxurians FD-317 M1]|uniref:Unplaced genomic scaffold GYMLUscaffold_83, whole genome shotgun sequence n=1 Tax=Collybiopsis luxurians FD-317 M1 TaxID=944289 RepID=A0A0D0AS73_9AGAR|nr:hypothetical protein GYMLUDRAFT_941035 [Collybiopsis luxurians FD-317 M1]